MSRLVLKNGHVLIHGGTALVGCNCDPCEGDPGDPNTGPRDCNVAIFFQQSGAASPSYVNSFATPGISLNRRYLISEPTRRRAYYDFGNIPFSQIGVDHVVTANVPSVYSPPDAADIEREFVLSSSNASGGQFRNRLISQESTYGQSLLGVSVIYADGEEIFGVQVAPRAHYREQSQLISAHHDLETYHVFYRPGRMVGPSNRYFPFVQIDITVGGVTSSYVSPTVPQSQSTVLALNPIFSSGVQFGAPSDPQLFFNGQYSATGHSNESLFDVWPENIRFGPNYSFNNGAVALDLESTHFHDSLSHTNPGSSLIALAENGSSVFRFSIGRTFGGPQTDLIGGQWQIVNPLDDGVEQTSPPIPNHNFGFAVQDFVMSSPTILDIDNPVIDLTLDSTTPVHFAASGTGTINRNHLLDPPLPSVTGSQVAVKFTGLTSI